MIALRILVGLARVVRRQIGNTGVVGCNRLPLEKITAFKFCLFGAAPSRESSFFRNKFDYFIATELKYKAHTFFIENTLIFVIFGFKSIIFVLDWIMRTLSFK